mmetsp:Transcript_5886/g.6982  ORF Transcript_5886/g.6982 Transcript_5886/m.6982 type:complete len:412 (+) Transcript_5886:213-1448(+)
MELSLSDPGSWGLDPLFWSNLKLNLKTVHKLSNGHEGDGVGSEVDVSSENGSISTSSSLCQHILCGKHPINRVHVMGIVVAKVKKLNHIRYSIDDGSAVIDCTFWTRDLNSNQSEADYYNTYNDYSEVSSNYKTNENHHIQAELGQLVRIVAKLKLRKIWKDEVDLVAYTKNGKVEKNAVRTTRELIIDSMEITQDPNQEVLHWLQCIQLYKDVYKKDCRIRVPKLSENDRNLRRNKKKQKIKSGIIEKMVIDVLRSSRMVTLGKCQTANERAHALASACLFSRQQIRDMSRIQSILQTHSEDMSKSLNDTLNHVLNNLINEGYLYRASTQSKDEFGLVTHRTTLEPMIVQILSTDDSPDGMWKSELVRKIRMDPRCCCIPEVRIIRSLKKMLDESIIYETVFEKYRFVDR